MRCTLSWYYESVQHEMKGMAVDEALRLVDSLSRVAGISSMSLSVIA